MWRHLTNPKTTSNSFSYQMREGVDYVFVEGTAEDFDVENTPIILQKEPYVGVTIQFNLVKFIPDARLRIKFDYDILDPGQHDLVKLKEQKDFQSYVGNIVISILKEYNG